MANKVTLHRLIFALTLLLALVLSACAAPAAPADDSAAGDADAAAADADMGEDGPFEVVMGIAANTDTLNPINMTLTTDWLVAEQMMDPLVVLDAEGVFQPWLAESWEISEDGTTWTFKLREDVTFHNGEPFNAEAVKFTFDEVLNPDNNATTAPTLAAVQEVNVIDEFTVEMVTDGPNPIFLSQIAHTFPMPPAYTQEVGHEGFNDAPVGTGAYTFVEWVRDSHVTMDKNPDWWNGEPAVDRITFRTIPEASARVASLLAGETDIVEVVPFDAIPQIEGEEGLSAVTRGGAITYIGLDTLKGLPTEDKLVRQALNYAVDAEAIAEFILSGRATPVPGGLWPVSPGWDPELPFYNDKDRARELLAEAGYPDGFDIEFSVGQVQGMVQVKEVGEAVQSQLAEVGINATINEMETATMFDAYAASELDMYFFPWRSNPEAARHFFTLLKSDTRGYYYQNPEMDVLIEDFMTEMDPAARAEKGKVLNEFVHEEAPWIFMYVQEEAFGVNSDRVEWDINPAAVDAFFGVELRPAE